MSPVKSPHSLVPVMIGLAAMASGAVTATQGLWLLFTVPSSDVLTIPGLALGVLPSLAGLLWCGVGLVVLVGRAQHRWLIVPAGVLNGVAAFAGAPVVAFQTESLLWVPYVLGVLALTGAALLGSTWLQLR